MVIAGLSWESETMIIRQAIPGDAQTLSALAIDTYADAFAHSMQASDLAAHVEQHLLPHHFERIVKDDTVLVAETQGRIVGFIQWGSADVPPASASNTDQEVRRLYVYAPFQNQGIGTQLMDTALNHPSLRDAERIFLEVWEQNDGARRLYERYGFEVIGERTFHVESGAETSLDLIMVRRAAR